MSVSGLAIDAKSVRSFDEDGRMHVETTPISKATINEYFGREIPNSEKLGLDPDRKYKLLRHPDELKSAAETFNNIPLMIQHVRQSADDPQKDKVVGSLGTDAEFDGRYLKNSMVVWDKDAIKGIQDGSRRELSCSYRYDADMTPGTHEGERYDGVMRNLRGNHTALVPDGRAGHDVLVHDSIPTNLKETTMRVSRRAIAAQGVLAASLRPMLANDAKMPDLKAVLLGTTAANWADAKPQIMQRLKSATAGQLAQDAKLEDVHKLLDSLDREGEDNMEPDEMEVTDRRARDETPEEKEKREREAKDKAARDKARDEDPDAETEEERKARMEKRAADKAAKDKAARDKAARDAESPEDREKREREEKEAREKERAEDKRANDEAIKSALAGERQRQADIREAERVVRPYIGEVVLAQDSADAVYRLALDSLGVDHKGVHPTALKAVLLAQQKPSAASPRLAHDAKAAKGFLDAFPAAQRIRSY